MAKMGFISLFINNFALLSKRSLLLTFRKNSRPKFISINLNYIPELKQQLSKIEIEVVLNNAIALKVDKNYLPVFRDHTKIKIGYYITPKTKHIKLKVIGVLQYKTKKIPVKYNTPDLQSSIATKNNFLKQLSLKNHKGVINECDMSINTKDLQIHKVLNSTHKEPKLMQEVSLNWVDTKELEQQIKTTKKNHHEEQLL